MWTKIKAMPVWLKVLLVVLTLGSAYRMTHLYHGPDRGYYSEGTGDGANSSDDRGRDLDRGGEGGGNDGFGVARGQEAQQQLSQFKSQQSQLMGQVNRCEQQMTQATQQMAQAAMNGAMVNNRPTCEQYMPVWTAQEAYVETEIYRIQTGDTHSSLRQITGISASEGNSSGSSSGERPSDGTGAVEDWDRGVIRGTSIYTDGNGDRQELATRSYYFRDRASGEVVGSDQPDAPNNGHDYEQLQEVSHPQ